MPDLLPLAKPKDREGLVTLKRKRAPRQYHGSREAECKQCGNTFTFLATRLRAGRPSFCSPKCWYAWRGDHKLPRQRSLLGRAARQIRPRFLEKKCPQCDKTFHAYGSKQFCSPECHKASSRVTLECANCKTKFERCRSVRKHSKSFCSRPCVKAFYKRERSPMWRGNRSAERGKNWPKQQAAARERDGNRCQAVDCTFESKQKPSVDHIIAYRLVKDGDVFHDPNDLVNLVCLCRSHHALKSTVAERCLVSGDVLGFWREAIRIIPADRVREAMKFFGYGTVMENCA